MVKFGLYLRHANDEHSIIDKNKQHKHDTHLNMKEKHNNYNIIKKLLKNYGPPDVIHYSPFSRIRETIDLILYVVKYYFPKHKITLVIDNNLSRYFNRKEQLAPSLSFTTIKYNPPIFEKKEDFNNRIMQHIKFMETSYLNEKVWCVTHALVFKRIAHYHFVDIPEHIPFLHSFVKPNK
jgi:broad specificity phosphatase PhoE